eukprot:scpid84275/ scgid28043/ 
MAALLEPVFRERAVDIGPLPVYAKVKKSPKLPVEKSDIDSVRSGSSSGGRKNIPSNSDRGTSSPERSSPLAGQPVVMEGTRVEVSSTCELQRAQRLPTRTPVVTLAKGEQASSSFRYYNYSVGKSKTSDKRAARCNADTRSETASSSDVFVSPDSTLDPNGSTKTSPQAKRIDTSSSSRGREVTEAVLSVTYDDVVDVNDCEEPDYEDVDPRSPSSVPASRQCVRQCEGSLRRK